MRLAKGILVVLLALLVFGALYGASVIRRGFSARETPSGIERLAATTARNLAIPSNFRGMRNPFPNTPANLRAGMVHFADHCATCHANDGSGNTLFGKGLYPKPPDMRATETQEQSDGQLYYTIENGVRLTGMPAFGEGREISTNAETWHLVLFIRHLPQLAPEELEQMKKLNPKTDADRAEEQQEEEFLNSAEPSQSPAETQHQH